jgi:ferredoxin
MVKVNQEKCIGCGMCASSCPETFSMDANNKAEVINTTNTDCAKNMAENCPVEAIKVN